MLSFPAGLGSLLRLSPRSTASPRELRRRGRAGVALRKDGHE